MCFESLKSQKYWYNLYIHVIGFVIPVIRFLTLQCFKILVSVFVLLLLNGVFGDTVILTDHKYQNVHAVTYII